MLEQAENGWRRCETWTKCGRRRVVVGSSISLPGCTCACNNERSFGILSTGSCLWEWARLWSRQRKTCKNSRGVFTKCHTQQCEKRSAPTKNVISHPGQSSPSWASLFTFFFRTGNFFFALEIHFFALEHENYPFNNTRFWHGTCSSFSWIKTLKEEKRIRTNNNAKVERDNILSERTTLSSAYLLGWSQLRYLAMTTPSS